MDIKDHKKWICYALRRSSSFLKVNKFPPIRQAAGEAYCAAHSNDAVVKNCNLDTRTSGLNEDVIF